MTIRRAGCRKLEYGGAGQGDGHAVRDDRVVDQVAWVLVVREFLVQTADRVGHAVAEVHAGVAESCGNEGKAIFFLFDLSSPPFESGSEWRMDEIRTDTGKRSGESVERQDESAVNTPTRLSSIALPPLPPPALFLPKNKIK